MSIANLFQDNDNVIYAGGLYGTNNQIITFDNQKQELAGTVIVTTTDQTVFTLTTSTLVAYDAQFLITGYCTAGANIGSMMNELTYTRIKNVGGVASFATYLTQEYGDVLSLGQDITAATNVINFIITHDTTAGNTWRFTWNLKLLTNRSF